MSALEKIRQAFPDLKDSSDSELLGEISKLTGNPYESVATTLGVAPRGTAAETVRQIGAGFAVDLPRMVGQGLKYTGVAPKLGQELVSGAEERAPGFTADLRGRGLLGEALVTGGRAIGPMAPAIAAAFVPGGQFVAPTVAAGLFGTSSAQETLEKLRDQGVPEEDALAAARRVGILQGPLEGVATATGLRAFRAARPLVGLGGTTAGVAGRMTDTSVLKPFAKSMGINLAVQPSTEVAQDVGTELIERAYGATPEDLGPIARSSALGGVGLTLLLGPLAIGGHVARANRAEKLKEALYSPETPIEIRAQALDLVMGEARRQNIPEANVDQWFEQQLTMEDARNAELAKLEEEQQLGERDLLVTEEKPIQQRIDQNLGLTRKTDRKGYEKQFEEAFTEGTGQRVADPVTGVERELTAGELVQRDLPQDLTVVATKETKQTTPSIFSELDTTLNKLGIKPTKNSRGIYEYMVAEGIDPASPQAEPVLNALANSKLGDARKAVAEIIRARSPRGTPVSTAQQPTGSVGVGSPVVQGGVGDAGRVDLTAGAVDGGAPAVGAPLQQAGVPAVTPGQPATTVATDAPPAAVSPRLAPGQFRRAPRPMTVLESARATPTPPMAAAVAEPAAPDIIGQIFGEQDAAIIRGFMQGRSSTELAAEAKANGIKGRGEQMIRNKIAGEMAVRNEWPKKIAAAKQKFGYTDQQIQQALEAAMAPDADTRSEVEREMNLGRADLYGVRMSETEAIEAGLEGSAKSAGGGQSATAGFTKLQKDIDAMYKRLETEKDPMVLAYVTNRLTELQTKVEAFEDREQARIRATAGLTDADGEVDLVAAAQQAEQKPSSVSDADAAKEAAAAKIRAERAAKLQADRNGLAVGDTVKNPKLGTGVVKSFAGDGDATTVTVDFQSGQTKELSVKLAKLEKTDAVQVESAASVPVQPKADSGKKDGGQVRRVKKPAAESKAQVPAVIRTEAEQAAQAWDVVAADFPEAPKFADLTKAQQNTFIGFGEGNWERGDVETELTKLARAAAPKAPSTELQTQYKEERFEREMRAAASATQTAPDDVKTTGLRFVPFQTALDIARRAVAEGIPTNWVQFHSRLDLTNEGAVRLVDAIKAEQSTTQPKLRALRTVTTVDEDNATVELQEQELSRLEAVPGVGLATDRLRSEGLSNLVDYVGGWYVTDSKVNWDGGFTAVDGQAAVLLRRGMLTDSERVEWTMYHEVGHAADQTHLEGGGVFSSLPEFNVRLQNGQIKPMGKVMKAAFDHYNGNPTSDVSKHLSYPFDRAKHGDLDGNGIREELFAQLWATYTTRDGREFLEDNLPEVADFMEQAYEQVKQTDYVAAKADETQRSTQAGGQATQGDGQPRQVPLRQTAVRFRASRPPQGVIDRNIAKLPKMAQQPVKRLTEALGDLGGKTMDYAVFTNELVKRAVAVGLPSAKVFADRLASRSAKVSEEERKIEKIADRYASIEDNAKGDGPGSVNEFLFESTRTNKWGYDTPKIKADPAMKVAFNKLGPKAQQFVKDVFAHGSSTLASKKKIVIDAANSEYDAMIKAAQDALANATDAKAQKTATAELAKLKAEKVATLKRFQTLFAVREGMPYAPIKRTGNYVVIGESAAYKAAKAKKDTATLKKLESDPDHYHVSFVDTKWQARNLKDNLAAQGVFTDTQIAKRAEAFDEMFSGEAALPALTKMRNAVDARATTPSGAKDPSAGKLLNIISQLYLEALAEGSARKSELRRRGVAGEVDMLQSFTQQGRADANFLASIEFEPKIQEALQQMRTQSRTGDRERKSEIFDELTKRYAGTMDMKQNPFINGLTNLASKFFLASSPAYYMQNLTQPFMMSLPAMAGRHDYVKSSKALFKAYSELGPLFKDVKLFDEQFDFSKVPADVRAAINELVNQGKVDIGLATEINEYKIAADNNLSQFANRLNKGMRLAVQKTEAINRLSTAIAAYRLEFERAKNDPKIADPEAAATQYAADILTDTHGDYTAFNAPRVFNTQWGKVALQFRKFQLIQIAFYYKLFRDAFTKPDERAVALKTLSYALGHTAVFAGMMGLPGYAAISFMLGLFGDEDEPYDLTADMRKKIGPEWADIIMRGAPTVVGMDLSGKIGAGNMLSIMPFSDADLSTNAGRAEALGTLMGGAALGMTSRVVDGLGLILNGDYYKGIERTMPKGVSDALKAGRQGAEGMTRRNGDVILPDSEISTLDTVFTALGVPAVQQTVTYERQNRMRDVTENFNDRTTRIKNDYVKAVREKDTAAMAEARAEWTKLQQTRQRNGLKPQPISNLLKAPQEQKAREQRTVGGVAYRQGQQKLAESIAEN